MGEIKRLDTRIDRLNQDLQSRINKMTTLENENPWVRAEKEMFENPESAEYSSLQTLDIPASKLRFHRI